MSMKYFLSKLIFLAIIIASPISAMDILHPGVKINNKPLESERFLLTRDELNDFLTAKEELKLHKIKLEEKEIKLKAYENAVASLSANIDKSVDRIILLSDKLINSANDKEQLLKSNAKLRSRDSFKNTILTGLASAAVGAAIGAQGGISIKF